MQLTLDFKNIFKLRLPRRYTLTKFEMLQPDRNLVSQLSAGIESTRVTPAQEYAQQEFLYGFCEQSGDFEQLSRLLEFCHRRSIFTADLVEEDLTVRGINYPWRGLARLCEIGFIQKRGLSKDELRTYNTERSALGLNPVPYKDIYWVVSYADSKLRIGI